MVEIKIDNTGDGTWWLYNSNQGWKDAVVKTSMNRLFLRAIEILQDVLRQNGIRMQKRFWMILIVMTNIQRMYLMK